MKNILFILTDQQRMDDAGCYGHPLVRTPCFDKLAAQGVRFTHAMTPSPVCTPARGCLQTGLIPLNHGQIFNPEFKQNGGAGHIPDDKPFFARILREKGYRCGHVGKWHVGSDLDPNPNHPFKVGYDDDTSYFWGYGFPHTHENYLAYLNELGVDGWKIDDPIMSNGRPVAGIQRGPKEAAIPYFLAKEALGKLDQYAESEDPFFLSINFWGPHAPYFLPEEIYNSYQDVAFEPCPSFFNSLEGKPYILQQLSRMWGIDKMTPEILSRLMGLYAAYTTAIDDACSRLVDRLKELGKLEDTLIVFTSDHGSYVGSHRGWDKGIGMYDCLTRIPLIVSNPTLEPGICDTFVSLEDLPATFLDLAGEDAEARGMDGRSLLPLVDKKSEGEYPEREYYISAHPGHMVTFQQRMVRSRHHKYIFNFGAPEEFYDLDKDPLELNNCATEDAYQPEIERMRQALREWVEIYPDCSSKRLFARI